MRMTAHKLMTVALAIGASLPSIMVAGSDCLPDDPHVPKRRSKGEKARNRKYRGSRP